MNGAIYVSNSGNTKIMGNQKVDATYATIKFSCDKSCPLMGESCYAQSSYTGLVSKRLDDEAQGLTPLQVAKAEAKAIDDSYNGGPIPARRALRLHVSGDSRTITGTRIINDAIKRWKDRNGEVAWSYTHAWRHVPRKEWNQVSILASIDNLSEVSQAKAQGYAPALTVSEHISDKSYKLSGSDVKWIPCPSQTRNVPCVECRLCFNSNRLFEGNFGIAFAAHGSKKESLKRRLKML